MAGDAILVVEDEPGWRADRRVLVASTTRGRRGAGRRERARHAAGSEPYDVLVLDRMLPDLEGLELLRLLRARGVATPALC